MLAKITLYDGTIYRIASKTVDTQDGIYLGRIKDELQLVSQMQEAGNAPTTVNLTIINHDNFIPRTKDLWAAELLLTNDNGVSWRGKINFCNFDADGNLYVTASEKTAPELELQLPDEVRQVYTVDEDFHQSSVTMTIPLVIGGTTSNPILLPTILIDKTEGVYLICVGEIRSVVKVYNGVEELPNTAYTAYTGTSSQAEHAGFAYVKISEDYRLNADGSYAEINVDVVGLKLGDFTAEECRNGALFLYYFLTTAATGINGWGCGIDQSEIDTASFQSAITLCNQLGYKLDGIMWLRQSAQSWIDQICQAIHGKYSINANGKRSLFIDYAGNASKKTFTASNMQVDKYGKNSYTSVVYNKGILSYDYNPITGLFMQSAQYENAESIAQIGEQKFVGESYLIKDSATALAVLEYTCKRSQTAAEAIEFKTDDIDTLLKAGDVITINRPDLSINNALYQIQNISITDYEASISAVKFDTSVFIVSGTPSSVNWGSEKAITPALTPAQATNLLLSTGFDINPDGTGTPYISGTFTVPDGGWLAAAVQYGIGTNPSNWTELALITDGRFKISPVNVGTVYSIRIRMITATGHSDYLRGQITATGDTTPPAEPTIAVNATDKTVTVQCGLDNPPYDMGGFQIYRKKSTEADSAYTLIAMVAANRGYASYSDYVSEYITYNYKAKSYDRSGNLSTNFSNVASVTVTGIQANDVAATALAMPTGSILRLSAKNCTTASIAEANGVKDVSGNGNHGRAYGGVTVLDGGEKFGFDGTDDRIIFNSNNFISRFTNLAEMTICFNFVNKASVGTTSSLIWSFSTDGSKQLDGFIYNNKLRVGGRWTSSQNWNGFSDVIDIEVNKKYSLTVVFKFGEGKMDLYSDGTIVSSLENLTEANLTLIAQLALGSRWNGYANRFNGEISCFRIYPRALTASEVKTIFMFPDDVTFGQLTADLIGANVIKAQNLVMTENIISNAAQINNAVFQSLIVTNGSTVAGQVDVGGRNLVRDTATEIIFNTATKNNILSIYASSNVKSTDELTISFEAKASASRWFEFFWNSNNYTQLFYSCFQLSTSYQKFTYTGKSGATLNVNYVLRFAQKASESGAQEAGATIYVRNLKLELGNKATTWTPAPEDTDASINAITTNIYSPNTTTINGGKITTGTIQAAAIAANAITANKLSVVTSFAANPLAKLTFNHITSSYLSNDSYVPNDGIAGVVFRIYNGPFVAANAYTTHGRGININTDKGYLQSESTFKMTAEWTFACVFQFVLGGTNQILFCAYPTATASTGNNGITIYINTSRKLIINLFNSSGTVTSYDSGFTITSNAVVFLCVRQTGTTVKVTVNTTTASLTTIAHTEQNSYIQLGNAGAASRGTSNKIFYWVGLWERYISDSEVEQLYKYRNDGSGGVITADRIATDAIKSRNYAYSSGLYSTAGTFLDLANGQIISKNFSIDSSGNATFKGALSGATGSFTGAVTANSGKIGDFTISNGILTYSGSKYSQTSGIISVTSTYGSITDVATLSGSMIQFTSSSVGQVGTFYAGYMGVSYNNYARYASFTASGGGVSGDYGGAIGIIQAANSNCYGLYVIGKIRANSTDYGSDEKTKKDFKAVNVLDKLKGLNVCAWRFDEEKLIEKQNKDIDQENIKIEAENKAIDAENVEIEKENEKRKSRKDGEPVELIPLKERKKLREHRIADKNANHPLNIGCMAGEFNKAFGTNDGSEDCLSVTDTIGVCMRAIQELAEISDAQRIEIDLQKAEIAELKARLKIQQDEKSDVEQESSYTEKSDNSKDADNLDFPDVGKMVENQQEEQK